MVTKISRDHAPCTRPSLPDFDTHDEVVTFRFKAGQTPSKPLHVFYSNLEADPKLAPLFQSQGTVALDADGSFSLNVTTGSVFTVSTIATAQKGKPAFKIPQSKPAFPLPYYDDFEGYNTSQEAKYFADQIGAWEIHLEPGGKLNPEGNHVMKQMVPELPIGWSDHGSNGPMTLIGMREWQDIGIVAQFQLPVGGNMSACLGARVDQMWVDGTVVCVSAEGEWVLSIGGPKLGGAYTEDNVVRKGACKALDVGTWYTLELTVVGREASAQLDGKALFTKAPVRDLDTGFAALGMNRWQPVIWDGLSISSAATEEATAESQLYQAGDAVFAANCSMGNGKIIPSQQFNLLANWQLEHASTGMCVTASSPSAGAGLSLQPCVHGMVTQQFRNDYTNIRNNARESLTLGAYKALSQALVLVGNKNGSVTLHEVAEDLHMNGHVQCEMCIKGPCAPCQQCINQKEGMCAACWKKDLRLDGASCLEKDSVGCRRCWSAPKGQWNKWSFFPNTGQLRNQYTADTSLGFPMCLTV